MALENTHLWLWNNEEGLHCSVTINYGTTGEKNAFFSFSGNNTLNQWKAYNDKQPEPLKPYFAEIKEKYRQFLKDYGSNYRISKLARNTGSKGRRVMNGMMILFEPTANDSEYSFIAHIGDDVLRGQFDSTRVSERQQKTDVGTCIGAFNWYAPRDEDDLWESVYD
jgi:hypothetical protein